MGGIEAIRQPADSNRLYSAARKWSSVTRLLRLSPKEGLDYQYHVQIESGEPARRARENQLQATDGSLHFDVRVQDDSIRPRPETQSEPCPIHSRKLKRFGSTPSCSRESNRHRSERDCKGGVGVGDNLNLCVRNFEQRFQRAYERYC
jgi:hypothetical protein